MKVDYATIEFVLSIAGLLATFAGVMFALAKLLLRQMSKEIDTRFASIENLHEKTDGELRRLDRDLADFKLHISERYVRREDYVRGQTVIEAKLDSLYNKLEVVMLRKGE
ncbi:MAG: hypothetical protein C4516_04200 [Oxalobacter sp.]|jgi:hypothetical protein|nr:MAG: hypothetical protein C4516_04200 [Oxalobacter sp.]